MQRSTDETCAALLGRVASGDRAALAEIFRLESGRMAAIARRIVRSPDLAEEVVQDAFVAIWTRAAQFDPARGSALGWIVSIARNRALNMVRDGARIETVDEETLTALGERSQSADLAYDSLPEQDALRRCLGQLEAERRRAIVLAYVSGMTHGEIASAMQAPLGTVKAWIRRGVISLQECLS